MWTRIHPVEERRDELLQFLNIGRLQYIPYRHTGTAASKGGLLLDKRAGSGFIPYGQGEGVGDLHLAAVAFVHVGQH